VILYSFQLIINIMKLTFTKNSLLFALLFLFNTAALMAQTKLRGKVSDAGTNEPLTGVSIAIKGKMIGTITDTKGNFALSTTTPTPFTVVVSSVGYSTQEIKINDQSTLDIKLEEKTTLGDEVVVSASRIEESVMKSPVTVEKMDLRAIQNTPSATFYDGLKNLKGVEVSTQSLTFSSVNTRGFNANGNVRMVQLIDGMDNAAPGLNFSVGNIVGISELDLESAELLPGAASALYGPNALNGILLMNSKSPFLYQGLSAAVKVGVMSESGRTTATTGFQDVSIRYAKAFNNKLAFKANISYLKADDWQAYDSRDQSSLATLNTGTRANNPNYNGVNIYGDENSTGAGLATLRPTITGLLGYSTAQLMGLDQSGNLATLVGGIKTFANLGIPSATLINDILLPNQQVSRTGYAEKDLVDYGTKSLKLNASLHYRLNEKLEAILQANWGQGTSVYTGNDRYSLRDFSIGQYKIELKGSDFFVRAYTTQERSGDSYAIGTLGSIVNEVWRPSGGLTGWYSQYAQAYMKGAFTTFSTAFQSALGAGQNPLAAYAAAKAVVDNNAAAYHTTARGFADAGRLVPGSADWDAAVTLAKSKTIPNGAKFNDKTNLYHLEGMYNLTKAFDNVAEVIVGGNYRVYQLNSGGSLFATKEFDASTSRSKTTADEFTISEYGLYTQIAKELFDQKFKLSGSLRYDKNENFEGQYTPRISGVFSPTKNHNIRLSYQTGFRIPTTQNQFIELQTPQAFLIGGLPLFEDRYKLSGNSYTYTSILANPSDPTKWQKYVRKDYKPERVATWEIGYKGQIGKKLFVDAYYYRSTFTNFDVTQIVVKPNTDGTRAVYSFPTNADQDIVTEGWALGGDYSIGQGFVLGSNVSYNAIVDKGNLTPTQIGYNTPPYRVNVNLANKNVAKTGVGFNVAFRYQDPFVWQSTFVGTSLGNSEGSYIPSYTTLDAQVNKKISSIKSIVKLGGTNLLGTKYVSSWGNPSVGSMFYVSLVFDELLNK
jgi:iron complex outermembrane receptor protein